jgi:hypothetical protein
MVSFTEDWIFLQYYYETLTFYSKVTNEEDV